MFKFALSEFLFERKIDGYHLYKRVYPFSYEKVISGGEKFDLIKFITQDELDVIKTVSKKDATREMDKYNVSARDWHEHHKLNPIKENMKYGYGTFADFIAEYTKHQLNEGWVRDPQYPESHFIKDHSCKIHCNYIVFDKVCMILKDPTDFVKFLAWVKSNAMIPDFSDNQVNKWSS